MPVAARLLPSLLLVLTAAAAVAQEEAQWLKEARARENQDTLAYPIKSQDGFVSAKIMGKAQGEMIEEEDSYAISLDIGSQAPVNCEVIVGGFDLAAILRITAELTFQEANPSQGKIEQRAIESVDAGVFGSAPYIAVNWLYRVHDGEAARVGGFKQIAMLKDGHGLYCAHLDLGYYRSFQNVARTLAETATFAKADSNPYFTEISTATLAGARVGVALVTIERDSDGDSKLMSSTALILPTSPNSLPTQDSTDVQWIRPDGSLINAMQIVSSNGELETNLQLSPGEDATWLVKGDFKGKAMDEVIASDKAPVTWIEQAQARRKIFGRKDAKGTELHALQWTATDPTRFMDSATTILSVIDAEHLQAREELGGISVKHVLDKSTGMPSKSVIAVGAQSLELQRVYIKGTF